MPDEMETFGTFFEVDGQPYVRLEGFGGVLIPVRLTGAGTALRSGRAVKMNARIERDHRGFPSAVIATSIEGVGSQQ